MDIIIKEAKKTENLFQIEIYDCDFCEHRIVKNVYFENEATAEKYGKEHYAYENTGCTSFVRVVMKNGKEAPVEGNVLYGDANHPGDIYICPKDLEGMLLQAMAEEGQCPYKCNQHWFPSDYSFCTVKPAKEYDEGFIPLDFEWDD